MEGQTKSWKQHAWETLLIFVLGLAASFLFCGNCLSRFQYNWDIMLYSGLLWVILWKGNEFLADYPNRFISWKEYPIKRLLIGIFAHIVFTLMASLALDQAFEWIYSGKFETLSFKQIIGSNLPAVIIAMLISLFMTARAFLFSWRDLAIEHEQLKAESMASRFASLKAQVNPHFLFNSLNVLSGLVYKDADLSARFIKKLAEVYRYVLDRQEQELVPIQEELDFVNSVVFLQQIRFGKNLHVDIDIPENNTYQIAPLALQMLIENAIKHNVISDDQPLYIEIKVEEGFFMVSNSLQKKNTLSKSTGVGLKNISNRYRFLTDLPVQIREEGNTFIVKIPIIESL